MATIYNYLDKKRKENPSYKYLSYESLYDRLKGSDTSLPSWDVAEQSISKQKQKLKSYEREQNPSFANSLYEWTDWGIDDTDYNWVKEAYNNSITGLAYQFATGKKKYKIDENYQAGVLEDIGSAVLSFAMPMDIASMFVGGWIGKAGLAGTAGLKSVQSQATKKLIAGGMSKSKASEVVAKSLSGNTISSVGEITKRGLASRIGAKATVTQTAAPILSGGALQGATLATFEGVRGALQSSVDGTDVWDGIKHGIMHGGIMGGAAGMVGASLNIINSGLWAKAAEKQLTTGEKVLRASTGAVGQVGAEATTFQLGDVHNLIADDNYKMEDFLRNYAVNVGMMGVLKVKSKLIEQGGKQAERWKDYQRDKIAKEIREEKERIKEIENTLEDGIASESNLSVAERLKKNKEIQSEYLKRNLDKKQIELNEFDLFVDNGKKYKKIVDEYINEGKDPRTISAPDYSGLVTHLRQTHDYMKKNFSHQQKDVTIKENALKKMEESINRWETEVFDRINDPSKAAPKQPIAPGVQSSLEFSANKYIRKALKEKDATAIELLRRGNEDFIKVEEGKVSFDLDRGNIDYKALETQIKAYESTQRKTKLEDITEDKNVVSKIQGIEEAVEYKTSSDISERISNLESNILKETNISKKEPLERERNLLKAYQEIETKSLGTGKSAEAYESSKPFLNYLTQEVLPTHKPRKVPLKNPPKYLKDVEKFVEWMAVKKNKSIYELTDADVIAYFKQGHPKTHSNKIAFIIKQLEKGGLSLAGVGKLKNRTASEIESVTIANVEGLIGKSGLRTEAREGMESYWKFGTNFIEYIQPKKGGIVGRIKKYVTTELGKQLKKYSKDTDAAPGHNDFLFRNKSSEAINDVVLNKLIVKYFKKKNIPQGQAGEHRAFRYSIEQHFVKKYGKGKEAGDVLSLVLGDTPPGDMISRYGAKRYDALERQAKKFVKEYLEDINNGYFYVNGDPSNQKVKIDRTDAKNEAGYNAWEIKEGLRNLEKAPDTIKIDGESIDKNVVKSMVDYMIQTAPRINEIVPKQSEINKRIKEAIKEEVQRGDNLQTELETAYKIASADEISTMLRWAEVKHKDTTIKFRKNLGKFEGDYVLGKLSGHLAEIAQGRARIDTIPHEISHKVINALKAVGDKATKALIERGIKLFKSEEKLVKALGEYTSNRLLNKSLVGKIKYWVSSVNSYFRQKLGLTSVNDIARMKSEIVDILGTKVYKGKDAPLKYMPDVSAIKVQYQTAKSKSGYKNLLKVHNQTRGIIDGLKKQGVSEKNILSIMKDELGFDGYWKIKEGSQNKVNIDQLYGLQERLNSLTVGRGSGKSNKKNVADNILEIETQYQIPSGTREKYFEQQFATKYENATKSQLKEYRAFVLAGKEVTPLNTTGSEFLYGWETGTNATISAWKRPFLTAGGVLRKYGVTTVNGVKSNWGKKLAESLDMHDYVRTVYHGKSTVVIDKIASIVGSKVANKHMHLVDAEMAKAEISQLKSFIKPQNKEITESQKLKFSKELKEVESIAKKFEKNGDYERARELWNGKDGKSGLSGGLFNAIGVEVSKNASGRELTEIMRNINRKYINNYFSRRVRPEVLNFLDAKNPQILKIAKSLKSNLTKKDLKKIADKLVNSKKIKKKSEDYYDIVEGKGKFLEEHIANEIYDMYKFGPVKVRPAFLKERGALLPAYTEIRKTTKTGKQYKEWVKTYESSLDGTLRHYSLGMSRFLATLRLFPEWTELGGKFSLETGLKSQIIKQLNRDQGVGNYALNVLETQLGIKSNSSDALNAPYLRLASKITNASAAIGLSSPTSGIKNVLIQIPRSAALFGVRNTTRAISRGLKIYNDPKLFKESIEKGYTGYGSKTVFEEAQVGRKIRWWFDNVNLMTKSENLNRIVLAEAGKMHFNELVNKLRGNKSLFHPKANEAEVSRYLKDVWRLTDKQIEGIKNDKNIHNSKDFSKIQDWVGFQSHKRGAGATGTADLPLWMSNKYGAPLTLFTRIAMSVTIDSYNNYVVPMKNGNFAPIIKATAGNLVTGAALYGMYDMLLGQQPPNVEDPFIDRAMSYIHRSEMLGVYGEILNPYQKELSVPIMEPVIIRNAKLAWENISGVLGKTKSWDEAVKSFALNTIVIAGQGDKIFTKVNHPYVTNYKRIKTLERNWRGKKGKGYEKSSNYQATESSPYFWKLKKAILLDKSDSDIANAYYAAYNYLLTEEEHGGITSLSERKRRVTQRLDRVISAMNPIYISSESKGREKSKRSEFLEYLSPENALMAKNLEKTYKFKVRRLKKILRNPKYNQSIYWLK
tara:strand:+ start:3209 stop:10090 length:6882 start_codon:yes stop_codon:yes gene_type:complete